jgi:putative serine protease PepD
VGAGAAGAAVALGVVAAAGGLEHSATTVREVLPPPTDEQAPVLAASQPLTVHDVFARAASGVVQVIATSGDSQHALGSGFVIDKAGHIVTSLHVVQDAQKVQVSFSNDERLAADVVGRDPATNVAVLQLKVRSRALTPRQLGERARRRSRRRDRESARRGSLDHVRHRQLARAPDPGA